MSDAGQMKRDSGKAPVFPSSFERSVGFLLNKAGQLLTAQFEKELAPYGLGARNYGVLKYIDVNGSDSQQRIGESLRIDRSTMVTLIDELEEAGYVARVRDQHDRRRYAVTLTAYGKRKLRSGLALLEEKVTDRFLADVSAEDRARFEGTLVALVTKAGYALPDRGNRAEAVDE